VDLVLADSPHAYGRQAHTFAELNAYSSANGHEVLDGPVDAELLAELQRLLDDADAV
jgi:hypothetical protein